MKTTPRNSTFWMLQIPASLAVILVVTQPSRSVGEASADQINVSLSFRAGPMQSNGLLLNLSGPASVTYVVECSRNLVDWTPAATLAADDTGQVQWVDTSATLQQPRCFYRAAAHRTYAGIRSLP